MDKEELKLNVMGSHTWKIVKKWESLMAVMGWNDPDRVESIRKLKFCFKILTTWDFREPEAAAKFQEYIILF